MTNFWSLCNGEIESFLEKRVASEFAMVAQANGEIVGYMLFDVFDFHGEITAFCPVMGHAEQRECRRQVFETLYQIVSEKLAAKGIRNHVATYFAHDGTLKECVFELGFGAIVMDAFRSADPLHSNNSRVMIVQADLGQTEIVQRLADASREFYLKAPLFLRKEKQSKDYYRGLFNDDSAIFLVFVKDEPVGFMNICKNRKLDLIALCDLNTCLIDPLGAYIKPEHRGCGIGKALLSKCIEWCESHGISQIHVDFESANLFARSFWPNYFTVVMNSVKRTLNKDV